MTIRDQAVARNAREQLLADLRAQVEAWPLDYDRERFLALLDEAQP